jgi:biotin carboxyl carrier protein
VSKYQININGKEYRVEIEDPNASPVKVVVNGKAFNVTVSDQSTSQPVHRPQTDADLEVYVPTVASTFVETAVDLETSDIAETTVSPVGNLQEVTAPMPGKILDIAVQIGAKVKHGDVLCNLEAMKMKSPIRSTVDGTIVQILIREGQNVSFGAVLFTLK